MTRPPPIWPAIVGADLRDSTQGVAQDDLAAHPVIRVTQGTPSTVMVDHDLEIF